MEELATHGADTGSPSTSGTWPSVGGGEPGRSKERGTRATKASQRNISDQVEVWNLCAVPEKVDQQHKDPLIVAYGCDESGTATIQ